MRTVILQGKLKSRSQWRDYLQFRDPDERKALGQARTELLWRRPGGIYGEAYYYMKRDWRVIIREIIEHEIE
jgi:hypothetical protein